MFKRMMAIVLGVAAVAVLNALAFTGSDEPISGHGTNTGGKSTALAENCVNCANSASAAQSAKSQAAPQPGAVSPFALARLINKSRSTETEVDLSPTWQRLGVNAEQFTSCGSDCEVKIFRQELSSHPGPEVILKLTQSFNFCRYLIFARAKDNQTNRLEWKFLGHVDHDFNKYEMSRHRVVRAFGRNWLVVRGQEGSGSGYSLYGETWFEVGSSGVKPVFNYAVDGHTDPSGSLSWQLNGHPVPLPNRPREERMLRLMFTVTYTASGYENPKFSRSFVVVRHADYSWDAKSGKFAFDPRLSTISEREMRIVANVDTEAPAEQQSVKVGETNFFSSAKSFAGGNFEMFLRLNLAGLTKIAQGPESQSKAWLRQFLNQCDNTPEKLSLTKILEKKQ